MFQPPFNNNNNNNNKELFLKEKEEARNKRLQEKQRTQSAIIIQSYYKGYVQRRKFKQNLKDDLNKIFNFDSTKELTKSDINQTTSAEIFNLLKKFFFLKSNEKILFENICKYLTFGIINGDLKHSYVSLIVSKDNYQNFLKQAKDLLVLCVDYVKQLNIKDTNELKSLTIYLNFIVTMTTFQLWKGFQVTNNPLLEKMLSEITKMFLIHIGKSGLFESFGKILWQNSLNYKPVIKSTPLASIINLCLKILQMNNYSNAILFDFCSFILINPVLIKHLNDSCSIEMMKQFKDHELCNRIYSVLSVPESIKKFLIDKDLNQSISMLANLCSMAKFDLVSLKLNVEIFIVLSTNIFEHCCEIVNNSKSQNNSVWHPFVGYLTAKSQTMPSEVLINVFEQLKFLWTHQFITILFDSSNNTTTETTISKANFKGLVKNIFDKALKKNENKLCSQDYSSIYRICTFYRKLLFLLSETKIEILSALSVEDELILGLWRFLLQLGPILGLKDLVKLLEIDRGFVHPIFDLLYLLTSLTLYLVTIFDEYEFYEKQLVFRCDDYRLFAQFLNNFLYKIISNEFIDVKTLDSNNYFCTLHQLLTVLHDKDTRRQFMLNAEAWIIKDIKIKSFLYDFEKDKLYTMAILNKIPHVIPHKTRVEILQNFVMRDKQKYFQEDTTHTKIKIRRARLVEDGYSQLAKLPINLFKGTIRVVFVNEYGLNEAGIDQDGVFKEFLQDITKQILNPEFNLFKVTDEQQLYPSSSSYFVEDHLELFEFIGKILGKAIYEGFVVDVQFAPFFLRQLVGYRCQNYSFFDDLVTLDRDLYKNLSSIKRDYDEETLSSLELTFTHTESHLGQVITHELVPSGSFIKVDSENKIKYIHLLALFKLHKQIKRQIYAFNEGFKSVIKQEWLNMFSVPEIQHLISGSLQDIDFDDLKKNVQYWGGLHSGHRLVKWLWEILENDFTREERGLFLKFVTSCSKPPLLGFATLNPPFTIRCVEVEEAEGTIYDASITGFFKTIMNISNKDTCRLPTSSTCFNLLKLPNYSKKSTLRDKLRYALRSNAGFELS